MTRQYILDHPFTGTVEMTCLEGQISGKNDEIYSIADNYVHKQQ